MSERPEVPLEWVRRLRGIFDRLPECVEDDAWVGVAWRVGKATVAHAFGGEDGIIRITFRADLAEVAAFEHLGEPYFRAGWGANVVGMYLTDETDWDDLADLLADSYRIQAPARLLDPDEEEDAEEHTASA